MKATIKITDEIIAMTLISKGENSDLRKTELLK